MAPETPVTGQTLAHYRLLAPIGRGAMGEVFAAEDVRLGRRVAVKLLPADVTSVPDAVERFEREARIISSLNHPNICTLFDIGVHEGRQFMVMELLEGATLAARLSGGPLPFDEVLACGADVAAALDAAHRKGVVHRDIKPANLFVTAHAVVKVLDFGVAKLADVPSALDTTTAGTDQLTVSGTSVGTVAYMSPEQARGEPIDGRSDLFSLGVVLYEMATGRQPFTGATAVIFEGILTRTPAAPSSLRGDLPAAFDAVVLKALEKDPARRYQAAADLRADLVALRRASEPRIAAAAATAPVASAAAAPAPAPSPRRSRAWWLAAPLATAGVVAAVLAWQSARTPALQSRDLVVLADLTNRTGDPVFDDTLGEALAVQLRQSPFLNLVPDQRVRATLRMMERPADTPIDAVVGREVCQRVGAKALLTSAIASLGSSYVITLGALDCVTGDTLAERQAQVAQKEEVLRHLGGAARELREHLGESLASLTRYDANIEQATTASLEALKAYSQAIARRRAEGDRAALPLFRRAIELDPDFALAHARLGTAYANVNDTANARLETERAYALRDKVSELERLYIEARYFTTVAPDEHKAIEAYRVTLATYPNDYTARVNLAILLRSQGELDEAISLLQEAARLAPEEPTARVNLASTFIEAGRFPEARATAEQARALRDDGAVRLLLLTVGVLGNDAALEREQLDWARASSDPRQSLPLLLRVALYRGQLTEAERLLGEIEQVFGAANLWPVVGELRGAVAISLATAGATARAGAYVQPLERDHPDSSSIEERLVVAAMLEDAGLARRTLVLALGPAEPGRPEVDGAPLFRALAHLAEKSPARALEALGPVRYRLGETDQIFVRGLILERLGRHDEAIADFTWLRDHARKELAPNSAYSRRLLAEALERAGRTAEARQAYAAFLDFWKTADRDLPGVTSATAALARLGS
jgi:eukaryotic-like serine/threonine-protein kinase